MSDRIIIKQIEQDEIIRTLLLGEDRDTLRKVFASDHPLTRNIYYQFLMNRLRGLCENCSRCCEVSDIDLSPHDIERVSNYLKISQSETVSTYCINHPRWPSFFYRFKHAPCIFLKEKRCSIYPARPNMCMFFPFIAGVQKDAWEVFRRTKGKQKAIVTLLWCASAVKIKDFTEKTVKMLRQMPPEALREMQHR